MNKLLLLTLFGLACAAHQAKQATQTAATVATSATTATKAQDVTYDAVPPDAYEAHYAEPPSVCYTGQCNRHSPCYNFKTGTCSPLACEAHASYGEAVAYQGEAGYGDDEKTDRRLQYGYAPPPMNCRCPYGTQDTKDWSMHKQTVLWVGFGFLFLPALCFLWRSFDNMTQHNAQPAAGGKPNAKPAAGGKGPSPALLATVTNVRINAGIVNMVASLAYLAMATKHGYVTRCNGRDFYYARYVDWIITTPLMLYDLAVIGGSDGNTRIFLCGVDIIMIVAGLIGSLVEDSGAGMGGTNEKWGFFGFSMLCFIPVIYILCSNSGDGKDSLLSDICNGLGIFCTNPSDEPRAKTYQRAMNLTVITWIVYPIIWILSEGTETISVEGENIAYTVLDILSKSVFGWLIVFQNWHLGAGAGGAASMIGSSIL